MQGSALNLTVQQSSLSLAGALMGALRPLGYGGDLTDVLGITGLAFRLALDPSATALALEDLPDEELADRLAPLAADFRRIRCPANARDRDRRVRLAERLVDEALSRGLPAIVFGLDKSASYSLIVGAGHDYWLASTQRAPRPSPLPRRNLGSPFGLDVIIVEAGPQPNVATAQHIGLRWTLLQAEQEQDGGLSYGLAAYRRWAATLDHVRSHREHQAVAAIAAETRAHGAAYLRRLAGDESGTASLRAAAAAYKQAAALLVELRQHCEGVDDLTDRATKDEVERLIREALAAETQALEHLRSALSPL